MHPAIYPMATYRWRTRGGFQQSCATWPRPINSRRSGRSGRRLRAFELRPIHPEQLLDGRRVLGSLVLPPAAREPRESDSEPCPRSNGPGRGRVDRTDRQLRSADLEDDFRIEPHIRFQFGVHAGGPSILSRPLQFLREFPQGLVVETGPELASRTEHVRLFVVSGHQQGSIASGSLPTTGESADHDEVNCVAQRGAVFLLELDPLEAAGSGFVWRVEGFGHEAFASGLQRFIEEFLRFFHTVGHAGRGMPNRLAGPDDGVQCLPTLGVGAGVRSSPSRKRQSKENSVTGNSLAI